jgi:hypothetical protein
MFIELLLASCLTTNLPSNSIIEIEGVCVKNQTTVQSQRTANKPVIVESTGETIDEFLSRQNLPGSEFHQVYESVYIKTYCDPMVKNIDHTKRSRMAHERAFAVTNQLDRFIFLPNIELQIRLNRYRCP